MNWRSRPQSKNVEDRRTKPGATVRVTEWGDKPGEKHVQDPVTGAVMRKGRPVGNTPLKPPSMLPDPTQSMPANRMRYHRNPNVSLATDTAGNRAMGNVGRVVEPSGGRPLEGVSGQVVRRGYPTEAPYSGNLRSKIGLGMNRVADTVAGMDQTITGRKPAATPAPRPATNAPGAVSSRRAPRGGATLQQTMDGMGNSPGYEPFPAKKKRR